MLTVVIYWQFRSNLLYSSTRPVFSTIHVKSRFYITYVQETRHLLCRNPPNAFRKERGVSRDSIFYILVQFSVVIDCDDSIFPTGRVGQCPALVKYVLTIRSKYCITLEIARPPGRFPESIFSLRNPLGKEKKRTLRTVFFGKSNPFFIFFERELSVLFSGMMSTFQESSYTPNTTLLQLKFSRPSLFLPAVSRGRKSYLEDRYSFFCAGRRVDPTPLFYHEECLFSRKELPIPFANIRPMDEFCEKWKSFSGC